MHSDLIKRIEAGCPTRWVALTSSFGVMSAILLIGAFLKANGYVTASGFVNDLAVIAFMLTWLEVRRIKDIAAALRARED